MYEAANLHTMTKISRQYIVLIAYVNQSLKFMKRKVDYHDKGKNERT